MSSSNGAEYFWSCKPEVYTSPGSKFDPESLVCESVRFVDPSELDFPSSLVLAAREMAIMHPRTCAVPELSSARVLVVNPGDDSDEELQKYKRNIDKRLNLKRIPIGVSRESLQSCLQFSIETRISPQWNRIGALFVRGRDFLFERVLDAVEARLRLDGRDGPVLSVKGGRVRTRPINLHDFIVPEHIKDDFLAKRISVVPQQYMGLTQVRVLPNLTWGKVESLSHETVSGSGLKTWKSMRRYWKNMYGFRLGDKDVQEPDNFYVNVTFGSMSTIFSYPNQCVLETEPVPVPGVKAKPIVTQFVADINDKIRNVVGQPLYFVPRAAKVAVEDTVSSTLEQYDRDKGSAENAVLLGSKTFTMVPELSTKTLVGGQNILPSQQQARSEDNHSTVTDQSSSGVPNQKLQSSQYIAIKTVPQNTAKESEDQKDLQRATTTFTIERNTKSGKKQPKPKAVQSSKTTKSKKNASKAKLSGEHVRNGSEQNQQMSANQVESLLKSAEDAVALLANQVQGPPVPLPLQPLEVDAKTTNVAPKKKISKRKAALDEKKGEADPTGKSTLKSRKKAVSVKSPPKVLNLQTLKKNGSVEEPSLPTVEKSNSRNNEDVLNIFEFESPSVSPRRKLNQTSAKKKPSLAPDQEKPSSQGKDTSGQEHLFKPGSNVEQLQTQYMACGDDVSHNDTTHLMTSFEDDEQVLPRKPKATRAKYTYSSQTLTSGMKAQRLEWSGDASAFQTK